MKISNTIGILLSLVIISSSFSRVSPSPSTVIQGVVISEQTGQPVSGAHAYVIHGEEEALTNSKGEFRVESWQKLPFRLTIEYKDYRTVSISIADPGKKQVIRLKTL
jgi:CarboxypepD_reg-like domain